MLTLILLMAVRRGVRETRIPNVELVALRLSPQKRSKKAKILQSLLSNEGIQEV